MVTDKTISIPPRASRIPWAARGFVALLVLVLGSVSSRTMTAEDSSFTRESRKPKASRRALLAATSRSIVAPNLLAHDSDDQADRQPTPARAPWRWTPLPLRIPRAVLLLCSRPEYLRPYSPSLQSGFLSPPA